MHPPQNVLLTQFGALGIRNRVVARRRFRKSGEHCDLREIQFAQSLAEIGLGGRRESVGPVPEVDLVDIEREYLVLREVRLDLERKQRFIELSRKGPFL